MLRWVRDKIETWRIRRWVKKHTMTQEQLERALEERYGIPRNHEVR
jgi:hypothetical protein